MANLYMVVFVVCLFLFFFFHSLKDFGFLEHYLLFFIINEEFFLVPKQIHILSNPNSSLFPEVSTKENRKNTKCNQYDEAPSDHLTNTIIRY